MNVYRKYPEPRKIWTQTAIECLNNHCVCGRCRMLDLVDNCQAKRGVLETYKKFGRPPGYIEPTIREDEE